MFHCVRCAGSYAEKNAKKPIVLVGKGAAGLEGIKALLDDDMVVYASLRVVRTSLCHVCKGLCGVFKHNTVYAPAYSSSSSFFVDLRRALFSGEH